MCFDGICSYSLVELGISQLYLSEEKIRKVKTWFCPEDQEKLEPLPVHDFGNGRYTLTDGHSRAYVALQYGISHIQVVYDRDEMVAGAIGKRLYERNIDWCRRFGLYTVAHLSNRIVNQEEYQRLWIRRCDRSYCLLTHFSEQERKEMERSFKGLFLYGISDDFLTLYLENAQGDLFQFNNGDIIHE